MGKEDPRLTPKPVLPGELHDEPKLPVEERIPEGVQLRVVWDSEQDVDLSHLEQWDTPEKYEGNEVFVDGRKVPFNEYMKFWGDPNRHVVLQAGVDMRCTECGEWTVVCNVGNVDFMDTDPWDVGAVYAERIAGAFSDYQLEVSRELLEQALNEIEKITCCTCKHTWTELALAREPDGYDPDPPVWRWCIRCGCLELEGAVYSPGPNQLPVILPNKE